VGHVEFREERESQMYRVWEENVKEKYQSEYLDIDDRIILKWILKKRDRRVWLRYFWLRIGTCG
jgi:hypothetical protein